MCHFLPVQGSKGCHGSVVPVRTRRQDLENAKKQAKIGHYNLGRRLGKKANVNDVYDIHARAKGGYQLYHIGLLRDQCAGWRNQLIENKRTSPADLAAFELDFGAWLPSLPLRDRHLAEDLGMGERTGDVAKTYAVSPSRVSQLRRHLQDSWEEFTADPSECPVT